MSNLAKKEEAPVRAERIATVRPVYLETLTMVERLHRRLLDVIKDEFDRRGRSDVNAVQALLLYNIGDKDLTAAPAVIILAPTSLTTSRSWSRWAICTMPARASTVAQSASA